MLSLCVLRFLLCASGESVKVFSTSTEECIHDLRGHTDLVTGVLIKPSNHLQVRSYHHTVNGDVKNSAKTQSDKSNINLKDGFFLLLCCAS